MLDAPLRKTPLHALHLKLKARMVPFAGYEMPVQYTSVLEEARATRSAIGLFDVSHMGQFTVSGPNALAAVETLVTNDLSRLALGQAQYNLLCNESGGVIDDLIVYHRTPTQAYLCVNASNREVDFKWMQERLPRGVNLTDESDQTALIAVQGPRAETLMTGICDAGAIRRLKYYWAQDLEVAGIPCYVSRTGYTGEDGFELYAAASQATELWTTLQREGEAFGLLPVGLGARDTLRLEMGYPLHGHELGPDLSPLAAGLGWVIKLKRERPFIGQEALVAEQARGVARRLVPLIVDDRRLARQGYPILSQDKRVIGEITSGTLSPHLEKPIALGFVPTAEAEAACFLVQVRDSFVEARKAKLPFVASHTKK